MFHRQSAIQRATADRIMRPQTGAVPHRQLAERKGTLVKNWYATEDTDESSEDEIKIAINLSCTCCLPVTSFV